MSGWDNLDIRRSANRAYSFVVNRQADNYDRLRQIETDEHNTRMIWYAKQLEVLDEQPTLVEAAAIAICAAMPAGDAARSIELARELVAQLRPPATPSE